MPNPASVPSRTTPDRVIVVAASPRTGSSLLCGALRATGRAGDPREYLGWRFVEPLLVGGDLGRVPLTLRGHLGRIRRRLRGDAQWVRSLARVSPRALNAVLRTVAAQHTSADGVFAVKLHWDHYEVMRRRGCDASMWGAPVTWVWVRRVDHLRQAISWAKATQTQQWSSVAVSGGEPSTRPGAGDIVLRYDADQIEDLVQRARRFEAGWRQYFADNGIVALAVSYEELDADYVATMGRVLTHLGIDGVGVPTPVNRRQADEVNEQWRERFIAERGSPAPRWVPSSGATT